MVDLLFNDGVGGKKMLFTFLGLLAMTSMTLQVVGVLSLVGVISTDGLFFYLSVVWLIMVVAGLWGDFISTFLSPSLPNKRAVEGSVLYYALSPLSAITMQILVNRTLNKMHQV